MSTIKGPAAAAAVLNALLPAIQAALQASAGAAIEVRMAAIKDAQEKLRDFANSTTAATLSDAQEVAAVDGIDKLARDLHSALTADAIAISLTALTATAGQLDALRASLGQLTAVNQEAAKSIALEPVKKAVDSMAAMVGSIKGLKAQLDTGDAEQAGVAAKIEQLITQFDELRKAVTKI